MRWPLLVAILASACFSKPGFGGEGASDARIDADLTCWSLVSPTNFEPCAKSFPGPTTADLVMISGTFNTETQTFGGGPLGVPYTTPEEDTVVLVHVGRLEIPSGVTVTVTGKLPLVFVSDGDILVDGMLTATKATTAISTGCDAAKGVAGTMSGAGGGGGGLGAPGGKGGKSGGALIAGGTGGMVLNNAALSPLVIGCPGAAANMGNMSVGGAGGAGGGAVELAAKDTITIRGSIVASGGGGQKGHGVNSGSGCGPGCSAGGGGGGAGGSILLEATTLTVAVTAAVCATGGGGGAGGNPADAGNPGADGGCMGGNGGVSTSGGFGGKGSESATPGGIGLNGQPSLPETSGGGGGGGAGRIRFHAPTQTINATNVAPAPSM